MDSVIQRGIFLVLAFCLLCGVQATGVVVGGNFTETGQGIAAPVPAPEGVVGTWEVMAPLPEGRVFEAVVASGQYVYVIGGTSDPGGNVRTNTTYRYDTGADSWSAMETMPVTGLYGNNGAVIDGRIYIPGGQADSGYTNDTYVYDIAGDSWSVIPGNNGYPAMIFYGTAASGQYLYVVGGLVGEAGSSTSAVWVLDTDTDTWSFGVPFRDARMNAVCGFAGGNLTIAGGVIYPGFTPVLTTEVFNGTAWEYAGSLPAAIRYCADAAIGDELWFAAGRYGPDWTLLDYSGYHDAPSDTWVISPAVPVLNQPRVYLGGDIAGDGYFYAIGGRDGSGSILYATNERFLVGATSSLDANFTADPLTGPADLFVQFTDTSVGSPIAWNWSFGDGSWFNTTDPAGRNATHTYTTAGNYTVALTVSGTSASDTETKPDFISVGMAAFFSGMPRSGYLPLTVQFTDESRGTPANWTWEFGDGGTSTAQDPSHTYTAAGRYDVTLKVVGAGGMNASVTYEDWITVYPDTYATGGGGSAAGGQTSFTGTGPVRSSSLGNSLLETEIAAGDGVATLVIPAGTAALGAGGSPVGEMGITPISTLPAEMEGLFRFAGYAWECTPAGATFSPPITLTLVFTPVQWAELDPASMVLEWYNPATGLWEEVPVEVDPSTRTVTAMISHFSVFAVFSAAGDTVTAEETEGGIVVNETTTQEEVPAITATATSPPTTQSPLQFAPVLALAAIPLLRKRR